MKSVAAIQMISGPEVSANLEQAAGLLDEAARQGAQLALLPECFAAMGNRDLAEIGAAEFAGTGPIRRFLAAKAQELELWIIAGSIPLPREKGGKPMATCLVYDTSGKEVARYDKLHLFDADVSDGKGSYRESDDYGYGSELVCLDTPVGRVGLSICYDVRFAEQYIALRRAGAELIVAPAAFTAVTGAAHWEILLRARAVETQCYILAANQGGRHPSGRETFGHSCIIDPWGETQALLAEGEGVICHALDHQHLQNIRARMPVERHRRFTPVDTIVPAAKES